MIYKTYEQGLKLLENIVEATRREANALGLNFRYTDQESAAREIGDDLDVEIAVRERETYLAKKSMRDAF